MTDRIAKLTAQAEERAALGDLEGAASLANLAAEAEIF